jgi:uncharacterized protein (DUF983 family)
MSKSKNLLTAGKLTSVLQERCPRCRKGHMFRYARYNLRDFDKMYEQCPHCGLNFELEPGFYTGAMYVSYAFSVAILIIVGFFLLIFFNDPGIYVYVITTLLTLLILFPALFRYSRVIYLHVFGGVNYRPDYQEDSPFMKEATPAGD